jgi:rubrerythrin
MSLVPTQSTNGGIQGKRLYLFIRSPDGDLIAMQANRRMKVIEFKATINRQIKVPVDLQMLLYNGKHMEDRQPLAAYNLPRDATIDVRIRAHASNGTRSLTIQEPEFDDPQQLRWNGNGEGPSTSGPSSSSSGPMSPGSLAQLEEEPPSCSHVRTDTAALFEDEYNEQREGMRETIAQMEGLVEHMKRLGSQQDNSNMEMRRLLNRTIGRKRHFKSLFVDMRSSSHALQSALDRSNEAIDDLRGKNADLAKFDRENYEKLSLEQLEQMEEDMERCLKHLKKFKKRKLRAYRSEISKQVRAMCVACETNERRTTLVPCGHFALCSGCAEKASECPICHAAITQRIATNFC